jgi:hypothetical protein
MERCVAVIAVLSQNTVSIMLQVVLATPRNPAVEAAVLPVTVPVVSDPSILTTELAPLITLFDACHVASDAAAFIDPDVPPANVQKLATALRPSNLLAFPFSRGHVHVPVPAARLATVLNDTIPVAGVTDPDVRRLCVLVVLCKHGQEPKQLKTRAGRLPSVACVMSRVLPL